MGALIQQHVVTFSTVITNAIVGSLLAITCASGAVCDALVQYTLWGNWHDAKTWWGRLVLSWPCRCTLLACAPGS